MGLSQRATGDLSMKLFKTINKKFFGTLKKELGRSTLRRTGLKTQHLKTKKVSPLAVTKAKWCGCT